jgi:hypothetical protein
MYNPKDSESLIVNGNCNVPEVEMRVRKCNENTLVELYTDLQAMHQVTMNNLLSKHCGEVEKLLKKPERGHAKQESSVEGIQKVSSSIVSYDKSNTGSSFCVDAPFVRLCSRSDTPITRYTAPHTP